ncbi:rCG23555, partial [Rattus norvegicus]
MGFLHLARDQAGAESSVSQHPGGARFHGIQQLLKNFPPILLVPTGAQGRSCHPDDDTSQEWRSKRGTEDNRRSLVKQGRTASCLSSEPSLEMQESSLCRSSLLWWPLLPVPNPCSCRLLPLCHEPLALPHQLL